MDKRRAAEFAERVVSATTGWTPESTIVLAQVIERWNDRESAQSAIDWVVNNWAERSRPPVGWIVRAYNTALDDKRRHEAPAREDDGPYPTLEEGYLFAAQGYEQDCRMTGKEPNWEYFNRMMGSIAQRAQR